MCRELDTATQALLCSPPCGIYETIGCLTSKEQAQDLQDSFDNELRRILEENSQTRYIARVAEMTGGVGIKRQIEIFRVWGDVQLGAIFSLKSSHCIKDDS